VHETLATDATDEVDFDTVVGRVVRLVTEGLSSPDRPVRVEVTGEVGELPGEVAMPLAVAVAELVQNAIDHSGAEETAISIDLEADRRSVVVRVRDGFSLDRDAGLGLTIVRTFVVSDLGGTITMRHGSDVAPRGVVVEVRVPRRGGSSTA
jgi:two-component sensor histidine kinase